MVRLIFFNIAGNRSSKVYTPTLAQTTQLIDTKPTHTVDDSQATITTTKLPGEGPVEDESALITRVGPTELSLPISESSSSSFTSHVQHLYPWSTRPLRSPLNRDPSTSPTPHPSLLSKDEQTPLLDATKTKGNASGSELNSFFRLEERNNCSGFADKNRSVATSLLCIYQDLTTVYGYKKLYSTKCRSLNNSPQHRNTSCSKTKTLVKRLSSISLNSSKECLNGNKKYSLSDAGNSREAKLKNCSNRLQTTIVLTLRKHRKDGHCVCDLERLQNDTNIDCVPPNSNGEQLLSNKLLETHRCVKSNDSEIQSTAVCTNDHNSNVAFPCISKTQNIPCIDIPTLYDSPALTTGRLKIPSVLHSDVSKVAFCSVPKNSKPCCLNSYRLRNETFPIASDRNISNEEIITSNPPFSSEGRAQLNIAKYLNSNEDLSVPSNSPLSRLQLIGSHKSISNAYNPSQLTYENENKLKRNFMRNLYSFPKLPKTIIIPPARSRPVTQIKPATNSSVFNEENVASNVSTYSTDPLLKLENVQTNKKELMTASTGDEYSCQINDKKIVKLQSPLLHRQSVLTVVSETSITSDESYSRPKKVVKIFMASDNDKDGKHSPVGCSHKNSSQVKDIMNSVRRKIRREKMEQCDPREVSATSIMRDLKRLDTETGEPPPDREKSVFRSLLTRLIRSVC